MKKMFILATLFFSLVACKKDNTPPPAETANKITGKWHIANNIIITRDSLGAVMSVDTVIIPGDPALMYYQFNDDNTWANGGTFIDAPNSNSAAHGTYVLKSEEKLVLSTTGQQTEYVITTLTPNKFVFNHDRVSYIDNKKVIFRYMAELTR